eukprot:scaffold2268_cov188-Alexandrium_tamarense.AAC.34
MAPNEDDYGLDAYLSIQAQLQQWGDSSPATSSRRGGGSGGAGAHDVLLATPASSRRSPARGSGDGDAMDEEGEDVFSPSYMRSPNYTTTDRWKGGVDTPVPTRDDGASAEADEEIVDGQEREEGGAVVEYEDDEPPVDDGVDSYRPYRDALLTYLQSRDRYASNTNYISNSMMQIDDNINNDQQDGPTEEETAALDEADVKFLESLAYICHSRCNNGHGNVGVNEASNNEGNFWALLTALREGGLDSLFYCVNGEAPPELNLMSNPEEMVESSPAEVLVACLGSLEDTVDSLPLQRLNAALGWIQACHARKWEDRVSKNYEGGEDPILPPPRRRTMWPATAEAAKRNGGKEKIMHPDAPLLTRSGEGAQRSLSPASVTLAPDDEMDDARLLRACFMLIQAGRIEEALKLTDDCGQPWRAVGWTGGTPLSSDGTGNPTRALWKSNGRKIAEKMTQITHRDMMDSASRTLFPSIAYEAAIMSLLSNRVDCALANPVFQSWEDGVHAILSAERGIIEDDVLKSHNLARIEAVGGTRGHFPYPGTEFEGDDENGPLGSGGDLGDALQKLETATTNRVRVEGEDPFRGGMISFLVGSNALKEYIEECAFASLGAGNEDEAFFLRFITHLILYVDTALPGFSFQLALPAGVVAEEDSSASLRELLLLKYTDYLASRRELWSHVAVYTSLLSPENIIDVYSSFLVHVHSDQERQMTLQQARQLFPKGLDYYVLRSVVREMIMSDDDENWQREAGEDLPPAGVSPKDARMMRSVFWLCYYPEHRPDALVCANMLLRKFLHASCESDSVDGNNLHTPKVFIRILPKNLVTSAIEQCHVNDDNIAGSISIPLVQNLQAEFESIKKFLEAHNRHAQFLDVISKTAPCHKSGNKPAHSLQDNFESEIADKMERNAFRQRKVGLCKIIIESAQRVSDALMEVLTFGGGWLVDSNADDLDDRTMTVEAEARAEEMKDIRSTFAPLAVAMLYDTLDTTGMWMEQVVYDTQQQFGSASKDILVSLFETFDESVNTELLTTSQAAPGYWHKKALSLASIVAYDGHRLHETFNDYDMDKFLGSIAESHLKLNRCSNSRTFFEC